ncbi:MAG: tetratricopeptide repeat protein [bacterium]
MRLIYCLLALMATTSTSYVLAADSSKPAAPEKKLPSMFAQPKKKTSADQLAYAASLRDTGKNQEAARQYSALVHKWSSSPEAPTAQLEYARLLEKKGDYADAFEEYEYLIHNYTGSFQYSDILESEFRIANCIMTTRLKFLGILPGSAGYETALPLFEKIVLNGPEWSGTPQAQFNIGWINEQIKSYDLAAAAYEMVQQNYPKSKFAATAAFRQGACLYQISRERPNEERSLQVLRTHLQKILRNYPDHELASEAAAYLDEVSRQLADITYDRALFYDKGASPKAALIAYTDFVRKFPDSAKAKRARIRIEQLETGTGKIPASQPDAKLRAATQQKPRPHAAISGQKEK